VYPEVSDAQKIWRKYGFESGGGGQILINGDGIIVAVNPSVEEILSLTGGD
jgi:PAS domain-containing protein